MNKILAFILLFLLGWAVSFIFANIIVTIAVCGLAGFLLFRRKKTPKAHPAPKASATIQPPKSSYGSRAFLPQEIVDKFRKLQAGDKADYMPIICDTIITDQQGRYWSLGVVDLKWHRFENNRWVNDEPQEILWMTRRSDTFFYP